jgi:pimeloyl-ACP methyl ester carboxylesterase
MLTNNTADAAALGLEIEAAFEEHRAPEFGAVELARWAAAIDELFGAGRMEAAEHAVRYLNASFPSLDYARNLCGIFDRLPARSDLPFIDDLSKDVQVVPRAGSDTVLFAFCGRAHRLGLPLTAVHRWFSQIPANLVYLRDFRRVYYLDGLPGFGPTRDATLAAMRRLAASLGARRIICYGTSLGTFAALHYGIDLEAEAVLCLAGSTNLSPEFNAQRPRTAAMQRVQSELPGSVVDLRQLYASAQRPPRVFFVCSENNWDDRIHADYLAGLPCVTVDIIKNDDSHNVIIELIKRGKFPEVLNQLMPSQKPAASPSGDADERQSRSAPAANQAMPVSAGEPRPGAPEKPRSHILISGTGRAGTSFLVRYLTELGLDTHLSRREEPVWDENAQAGLEDPPIITDPENLPRVVKTPWMSEYIDHILGQVGFKVEVAILPVRDLVDAASSRLILEMQSMHQNHPNMKRLPTTWENWGTTPGGAIFSLNPLDQARILALGFHRLVQHLVEANVQIVFLQFPRLIEDADYVFDNLKAFLPTTITAELAREAHQRVAHRGQSRTGKELESLSGQKTFFDPAPSQHRYASPAEIEHIAVKRELQRLDAERHLLLKDLVQRTSDLERATEELDAIIHSLSWQWTKPFRMLRAFVTGRLMSRSR